MRWGVADMVWRQKMCIRDSSKAQDTVVILQAEGKKAVENLDEILDVPGIDVVFVGPYDLSSSLGHVGEIDHPEVVELSLIHI